MVRLHPAPPVTACVRSSFLPKARLFSAGERPKPLCRDLPGTKIDGKQKSLSAGLRKSHETLVIFPVFMNTLVGYVIAKYKFKARGIYYGIIVFSMTIPTLGATSAIFKLYSDLNLYDTGPLLLFVTSLGAGGMNFLVMHAYFRNVPWEYAEAAFMDGAGHFMVFLRIMLPMALPAMGAIALIAGIGAWNEYMNVLMYMPSTPTLASGLYGLSTTLPRLGNTPAYYAALVIALIPILVIFCIFSDKIMRNFSVGGLK